ncbi:competence protein CoiA [Streptococcus macacae]|uniref:CoiA-like protein n=1 Tax=Streptococcus macacae NCTC 11558 TaxID=764298 RepID=G5JUT8_9STRE|nr:competence protein CoiA family protein [Streptococcus macacae]EHJ51898.1 CoiA-like protein [Streptococcus macacae NCTC 11558]SUN78903.1 competence protein/transcription factor [Streptococcus macacae NCTC 11558]
MLSARNKNGKLVNLLTEIPVKGDFYCPVCQSPVRLKKGKIMRPHFAHISLQGCQFYSENESAEHLNLKAKLYWSLSQTERVEIEKIIAGIGQIADLLINHKLALEVQCSRLSEDRLRERTQAYQKHGYQVLWLLGEKLWLGRSLSSLQKQFLYFSKNMGFHLWELDIHKHELRLKYLIYEDLFGRVYYKTQSCSFNHHMMSFLRLPYVQQAVMSYHVKQRRQVGLAIQKQLMARNPYWLRQQEAAYLQGRNLIAQSDADFFPQVRPPQCSRGFCQINQDLIYFRTAFFQYYQKQGNRATQELYPPAFYDKMKETNH